MNDLQPPVTTCSIGFTETATAKAAEAGAFAQAWARIISSTSSGRGPGIIAAGVALRQPFGGHPRFDILRSQLARRHVTVPCPATAG